MFHSCKWQRSLGENLATTLFSKARSPVRTRALTDPVSDSPIRQCGERIDTYSLVQDTQILTLAEYTKHDVVVIQLAVNITSQRLSYDDLVADHNRNSSSLELCSKIAKSQAARYKGFVVLRPDTTLATNLDPVLQYRNN